ncbi:hypothetical protein GCM10011403_23860 [Pseudohongiella nitratireducens]|jgi:hypothetical protein|uniref:DUF2007 domain-containing protein n=1 Tax=Pseudohongiella nitratireducens TaxID=1768907 RepID=A0A916QKY5_9GAMM|nr:DUF2007 domain-containing protein [Pseudohongiella nitratireducens]MDF1624231.1 DUF2007 domain-containing protein [Pseudohongiella nitratireducens]GFZ79996.1 hypothetical protein GCM10011403_23860 [Pseudohongiella nitratireducens]|tara:strand:- start:392 stop:667 length:276 start_codon:yes stop_codon:yes gene_type:complete
MLKTVFRANDIVEAHIVAGMLQAEGIKTFVGGHYLQGAVGDLAVQGFADVQVLESDVGVARSLITEYEASAEQEQNSASQTSGPVDGNLLA